VSDGSVGGRLILVATPIGNLGDLSQRAVEVLAAADLIACEDTRRTGRLLQHAGITGASLVRVDQHTEDRASGRIVDRLARGGTVAVVTDAGTPGISDPGERLVRRVLGEGFEVSVVPGPSAPVAALVVSGLPTDRWTVGQVVSDNYALVVSEEAQPGPHTLEVGMYLLSTMERLPVRSSGERRLDGDAVLIGWVHVQAEDSSETAFSGIISHVEGER